MTSSFYKNFRLLDARVNGICLCVYFLIELTSNNSKVSVVGTGGASSGSGGQ